MAKGNEVLRSLDKAKTQTYHFKAIIIAGMGFFTDAYDIFVISVVVHLLGRIYYYDPARPKSVGILPANVYSAVTATALCGTVVGQLFFGWAGDKWGRKRVYGVTLAIMVVTSLGQGLSLGHTPQSVITTLCFFRFWLGFGIGGDYPLSATIMSEYANSKTRGSFVAAVFSMQGIGILTGGAVSIIVSAIFKAAYPRESFAAIGQASTPQQSDFVWRIILMFGAVPAAMTFYSRSHMPETARYTALVERDQELAARNMGKVLEADFGVKDEEVVPPGRKLKRGMANPKAYGLFSAKFARRHGMELVGTCMSWFLLDISFYSQNLFQSNIFQAVGWLPAASHMSALEEVFKNGRAQSLIALVSTVPGYWFTVAFIDVVGRKPIQLMGFAMMSIFMYILALDFYSLRGTPDSATGKDNGGNHLAFIILYAFTFFFSNFGPNATTFIVPSELFPARLRSTCHGISSACGKIGSIVGTFGFLYASQSKYNPQPGYPKGIGIRYALLLLAICSTMGLVFTFFIPETKGRSLEDLSGEDDEEDENAAGDWNPNGGGVKAPDNSSKV